MIQSSQVINGIGKQRLIHSNPIQRSLKSICQNASLSEQFADIPAGIVISVYNLSTGLTDIGFVNLARFIDKKYKNNAFIYLYIPQFIYNLNHRFQDIDFLRVRLKCQK